MGRSSPSADPSRSHPAESGGNAPAFPAIESCAAGNGAEPESLDIHRARSEAALTILRDLYEGLTEVGTDGETGAGGRRPHRGIRRRHDVSLPSAPRCALVERRAGGGGGLRRRVAAAGRPAHGGAVCRHLEPGTRRRRHHSRRGGGPGHLWAFKHRRRPTTLVVQLEHLRRRISRSVAARTPRRFRSIAPRWPRMAAASPNRV